MLIKRCSQAVLERPAARMISSISELFNALISAATIIYSPMWSFKTAIGDGNKNPPTGEGDG
jgi:hypothetical protein